MNSSDDKRREFFERERHTRDAFLRFLRGERDFPEGSIGVEIPIAERFRPDITLVDPASKELLALIETTATDSLAKVKTNYAVQLLAYRVVSKSPSIPLYLVAPPQSTAEALFRIFKVEGDGTLNEITAVDFPSFGSLRNTVLAGSIKTVEAKQRSVEQRFRTVVSLLAVLVAALLVTSLSNLWQPTWEFLALLGGLCVPLPIPVC